MCRNWSKIGLCGPKSVHDHGDGISYFVTLGFYGFLLNRLEDIRIDVHGRLTSFQPYARLRFIVSVGFQ